MTDLISEPGFFLDMPETVYHSDPVATPSLSSSIGKILWNRSPLHAKTMHARLGIQQGEKKPTREREIGTATHKLLLGRGREMAVIQADDYKSKAAQLARAAAYSSGYAPILAPDHEQAKAIARAAMDALVGTELEGLPGNSEVTGIWYELCGAWCRMRIDKVLPHTTGHATLVDVKTTSESAHPLDWSPSDNGADFQAAFYIRGMRALDRTLKSCRMLFLVIEQEPPYGISINYCSGEALAQAELAVDQAILIWQHCLKTKEWPCYPKEAQPLDAKPWHRMRSELRTLDNRHLLEAMAKWQRP